MRVKGKRLLSVLLTLAMVAGMFVLPASAAVGDVHTLEGASTNTTESTEGSYFKWKFTTSNEKFNDSQSAGEWGDNYTGASSGSNKCYYIKYANGATTYGDDGSPWTASSNAGRAIGFTTEGPVTVKAWVRPTKTVQLRKATSADGAGLKDADDITPASTTNNLYTWTLKDAGTYAFVASTGTGVAKIEVTELDPNATTVSLDKGTASLAVGKTLTLTATATEGATLAWESDATGIATVDNSGVVTAVAAGEANIKVTATKGSSTATATCVVSVIPALDGVLHVFSTKATGLPASTETVKVGNGTSATVADEGYILSTYGSLSEGTNSGSTASYKDITLDRMLKYTGSSRGFAFIAPANGTLTVYFATGTASDAKVQCIVDDGEPANASTVGGTLLYTVTTEAGKEYKIDRASGNSYPAYMIWTTSDWSTKHTTHDHTVEVTENGETVKYCSNPACLDKTAGVAVVPVTDIEFQHTVHVVYIDGKVDEGWADKTAGGSSDKYPGKWKLAPTVTPSNASGYTLKYLIPDDQAKDIFSVNETTGEITPLKVGNANVTVVAINKDNQEVTAKNQCQIRVRPYVKSVAINGNATQSVKMGETLTLAATVTTQSGAADDQALTWAVTEGGAYASVNASTGVVTPIKAGGPVKITATRPVDSNPNIAPYEDAVVSDPVSITVNKGEIADWSISVQHEDHGSAASTATVTVTGIPEGELGNVSVKAQTGSETEITGSRTENTAQWTLALPENTDPTAKTYTITAAFDNTAATDWTATTATKTTTVSKAGAGSKAIQVTVTGSPALTENAVTVTAGATLTLTAAVKTANDQTDVSSQVDLQWKKDGVAIDGQTNAALTVDTSTVGTAKYTCTATPKSDASDLTGVTATSSTEITVTVTAAPITAILATIDTTSNKVTYDGSAKTLTVKGGTPVTFTIATTPAGRTSELSVINTRTNYADVKLENDKLTVTPKRALKVTSSEQPWNVGVKVTANDSVKWEVALAVELDDAPAAMTADQVAAVAPTTPDGKGTIKIKNPVQGTTYCYREGSEGEWTDIADPAAGVQVDAGPTHTYYVRVRVDANLVTVPTGLAVTVPSYAVPKYNITLALTQAAATVDGVTYSAPVEVSADSEVVIVVTPNTGYVLPNAIAIPGVSADNYTWDTSEDGATLTLSEYALTGNTTITITALDPSAKVNATMGWKIIEADAKTYAAETKMADPNVKGVEFYLSGDTWKWVKDNTLGTVMQGSTNPTKNTKKPTTGAYLHFKALQAGTLKVNVAVMSDNKKVNVTDGTADLSGYPETVATKSTKTVTIQAEAGKDYYVWVDGSKIAMQSYTFTTELSAVDVPVLDLESIKLAVAGGSYATDSATAATVDDAAAEALKQVTANIPASNRVAEVSVVDGALAGDSKSYTFKVKVAPFWDESAGMTTDTLTMSISDAKLVESVSIEGPDSVRMRESITLTAKVTPADATVQTMKWTSSDETKATVGESTGKVSGKAEGTVTITATATDGSGKSATKTITVLPADPNTFDPTFLTTGADKDPVSTADVSAPFGATNMIKRSSAVPAVYAIETKSATEGAFTVTIPEGKIGKLNVDVASTGDGNTATFQMTDASGKVVANKESITSITGGASGKKTLTYENLPAGTYTLAPTAASAKAMRVYYAHVDFTNESGETEYTVTVANGTADKATAAKGETVKVTAAAPAAGKVFDKWTSADVTFADATKTETTFTMPEKNVTVTATYKDGTVTPPEPEKVDKDNLVSAIASATDAMDGIKEDTAAANVDKGALWVTTDEKTALTTAIATAQAVADKADATQAEVDAAVKTLSTALDTFIAAVKEGEKTTGGSTEPVEVTKTLDASELKSFEQRTKSDGQASTAADWKDGAKSDTDYFTILWSASSKGDTSGTKTWTDGYTIAEGTPRLNLGGKLATNKNAVKFTTTTAPATVKVWWVEAKDDNNPMAIMDATKAVVAQSAAGTYAKNSPFFDEFTLNTTGEYYLGGLNNGNFILKVQVVETKAGGDVPVEDVADKTALKKAVADAEAAVKAAKISTDGKDVATTEKWVTEADVNTLNIAIKTANLVVKNAKADQTKVNEATAKLNAAIAAFQAAGQNGTKTNGGSSSSGGGSSNVPASGSGTTVKNEDGSTTTTKTNKTTGTVTETTTWPNGDKQVVVTEKDGTKTETVTKKDGTKTETVTKPDGSITASVTDAQGIKTETSTTASGETSAKVTLPKHVDKTVVTIPVKDATEGTVAVIVDAKGNETVIKTSVATKDGLELLVTGNVSVKIKDNAKSFQDIADGYWAKGAVDFVSSREIFKGTTEVTFSPLDEVNRGMMATVLYRLGEGKAEGENVFFDVPDGNWYTDAVVWANRSGVVTGYADGTFGPADAVTREQMATMLFRFAKAMKMDVTAKGDMSKFSDANDVSSWASEAMTWAVGVGIINGVGDPALGAILAPAKSASRAEVATIMQRMVKLMMQ